MKEIRKVMVAMEFSENVSELFDFAAGLALKLNSDLVAVNVINERDVDGISKIALMGYEISGENYVEEGADMIVVGIKAHTELEHFLVGSVAEKMFRHSPITLVSFRDEKSAQRLKKRVRLN